MQAYATSCGEDFWGSMEFFEDSPEVDQTVKVLEELGFQPFSWSTVRLEKELTVTPPQPDLPKKFAIRPLHGITEAAT